MSSQVEVEQNKHPVIQCDSVYKIFGENAKKMLQSSKGEVDAYFSRMQAVWLVSTTLLLKFIKGIFW